MYYRLVKRVQEDHSRTVIQHVQKGIACVSSAYRKHISNKTWSYSKGAAAEQQREKLYKWVIYACLGQQVVSRVAPHSCFQCPMANSILFTEPPAMGFLSFQITLQIRISNLSERKDCILREDSVMRTPPQIFWFIAIINENLLYCEMRVHV